MSQVRKLIDRKKIFSVLMILPFSVFACLGEFTEEEISSIRMAGFQSADKMGRSVAAVGHVNRDSQGQFTDILVGAPSYDNELKFSDKGAAYLIFGRANPPGGFVPLPDTLRLTDRNHNEYIDQDEFNELPPFPDITFVGSQSGGNLGFSVSGVGDVNGDGFDDFLIGAPLVGLPTDDFVDRIGTAYLVFGGAPLQNKLEACEQVSQCVSSTRMVVRQKETGEKGYVVVMSQETLEEPFIDPLDQTIPNPLFKLAFVLSKGQSQSNFGFSLSGVGDVDMDGCPDFLIGAPFDLAQRQGRANLYLGDGFCNGGADLLSLSVTPQVPPITPDAIFTGFTDNDHLGLSMSGVGDANGDGFADMLIGAPSEVPRTGFSGDFQISTQGCGATGHAYLFLGKMTPVDTNALNADVAFGGEPITDFQNLNLVPSKDCFGISVAGVGDVSGDGLPDFIIGAPLKNVSSTTNQPPEPNEGTAYIFFGSTSLGATPILGGASAQIIIQGSHLSDFFGAGLAGSALPWTGRPGTSGLWDFNGDGISDMAIGATNARVGDGSRVGVVYLFFGGSALTGTLQSGDSPRFFTGALVNDLFGTSIGVAGDFNDDQRADFLMGSPLSDNDGFTDNGLAVLQLF